MQADMRPFMYVCACVHCAACEPGQCLPGEFCAMECFNGAGCPAGTLGKYCQPCAECHSGEDAVAGTCSECSALPSGTRQLGAGAEPGVGAESGAEPGAEPEAEPGAGAEPRTPGADPHVHSPTGL